MMTVIGYKGTPESRMREWTDLRESAASFERFKKSSDEHEQNIAAIDADFYQRRLKQYVTESAGYATSGGYVQ